MDSKNYTPIDFLLDDTSSSTTQHKEAEPTRMVPEESENIEIHEVVEHEPSPDLSKYVHHHKETVEVPPDLKKIGIVATSNPSVTTTQPLSAPLSDDKIISGLHAPITSSLRWFAEFCIYLLKTMHVSLKEIKGKPVRSKI